MELDYKKVEAMVPQRFHKWLKVFGNMKSERIPLRKVWDHAIDLKEDFKASKARIYLLMRVFCVFLSWWYPSIKQLQNKQGNY